MSPPHYFTDSTVALCWIKGTDKTWKPFVQNRVNEIRKLTSTELWKHCSGKNNPADLPSRGLTPLELSRSILWRGGPDWLHGSDLDVNSEVQPMTECLAEMRAEDRKTSHGLLTVGDRVALSEIIDCENYSSLDRLFSVTSLVLKFCKILLSKIRPRSQASNHGHCSKGTTAEEFWLLECQKKVIADKKFKQWQKQLDLFVDEKGLWRCRGRIENANVSYTTKYPVLLHNVHYLTTLFIKKAHSRVLHNGVKETLTELRSKFWIVKGRSVVKKIIHRCHVCKRHEGKPYSTIPPPPLPSYRVEEAPPFSFTGVDFAGPLYIKIADKTSKVWICLYTCCVVRAIHLDLVPDMSTAAFIRSLKRFIARRGLPSKMLSDNGKTFKGAAKEVNAVFTHPDVTKYLDGFGVS